MTAMCITPHGNLPHDDPDASLAFYRDPLGFEVRNDVGYGGMRWIAVGPADQPRTSIVLHPPAADPAVTDDERRTITEMMAKGSYAHYPGARRPRRRLRAHPHQRAALSRPTIADTNPAQPPGLIYGATIVPVSHPVRGGGEHDDKPTSKDLP
jgi:catechol 2,3-dioxygenase-like lactoylglutathione lyase family enzyme